MLDGGMSQGDVTLVYGDPESGKTTFAMQCAVNCARKGLKVLFVDCDGTFSTKRFRQLASDDVDRVADHIVLMKPEDFGEQTSVVDHLDDYLTASFGLVVIDSFSTLYRLRVSELPSKTFELNRELNRQAALVAQTAKTRRVVALMTSQVRSAFGEGVSTIEPVGTRVLKFWADTIIALHPSLEAVGLIDAVLEKIPSSERAFRSLSLTLRIEESGIRDYPVR
jgi:DNA repair protein RadB